jgi:hypothetical protein
MKYVDFLLQRDERGIRVKAVQSGTAEMLRDLTQQIERLGLLPMNELGSRIQEALHGWGYERERDYNDTLALPLSERVMFMSADGDRGAILIVELPVTVSPAHESDLIELARTWLASIELIDVEIRLVTSTN